MFRALCRFCLPSVDLIMVLPVFFAGLVMKMFRRIGADRLPQSKFVLLQMGVFPIRDHYYEPLFHPRHLRYDLKQERDLPGIDWNEGAQLQLLTELRYANEILGYWDTPNRPPSFYINNGGFEAGDAEYWYSIVRHFKPARIIEVGSGNSTLLARQAIIENSRESPEYQCEHVCIEPYEMPWLEHIGVSVLRQKVEEVDADIFNSLQANDILFIDSSHVIRPQGDVLTEFLEILPRLSSGVIVHVHDIFSPRDYASSAIIEKVSFWNEQYLLEAFLTENRRWEIIGALNFLRHAHFDALKDVCPYLDISREPGSFYIRKL